MKLILSNLLGCAIGLVSFTACSGINAESTKTPTVDTIPETITVIEKPVLDTALYYERLQHMVNGDTTGKWPVNEPLPKPGAIFPFKRILAYYGNFYSTRMGILGEFSEDVVLEKLKEEVANWQKADTAVEVVPALHYIATTAQQAPGKDSMYRMRMPFSQIEKTIKMAEKINALVFIDIQVGLSTLQKEVPKFEEFLKLPHVHLGIDPEFSMKGKQRPGTVIGYFEAEDINYTTKYLADLVEKYDLPPKVLVVHRFTQRMVKDYKNIILRPEVQISIDMDGWGSKPRKISTYKSFVHKEPIQYTGFKLFYKNDFREPGSRIMTPEEVLSLKPRPMYIQYQ